MSSLPGFKKNRDRDRPQKPLRKNQKLPVWVKKLCYDSEQNQCYSQASKASHRANVKASLKCYKAINPCQDINIMNSKENG